MSSRPHIIRLRGPWLYEPLLRLPLDGSKIADNGALPASGKTHAPFDWAQVVGLDFRGRVRYTRHFGRPTGLVTTDLVQLVVARIDTLGAIFLNGEMLHQIPPGQIDTRVDITQQLQRRNVLNIEVEATEMEFDCLEPPLRDPQRQTCGLTGEVRLEIFSGDP